jgi:hypothetical protein
MQTEIEISVDDTGHRIARTTKQRDAEAGAEFPFRLLPIALEPFDDKPQTSIVVESVEGVTLVDELPHAGTLNLAFQLYLQAPTTSLRRGVFEKELRRVSRAAGDDPVEVAEELRQVPKVLTDAGYLLDNGDSLELLKLPGTETEADDDDS